MQKACFSFAEEQAFLVIIGGGNAPINFLIFPAVLHLETQSLKQ